MTLRTHKTATRILMTSLTILALLAATTAMAQRPIHKRPDIDFTVRPSAEAREAGISFYRIESSNKDAATVEAFDQDGSSIARLTAQQTHQGVALRLVKDGDVWSANFGLTYMHETEQGMFTTAFYDISRASRSEGVSKRSSDERKSFVFLSDSLGEEQLNVTYVLNGQPLRTRIADITPELENKLEVIYQGSGAIDLFEAEDSLLAYTMLSDPNLKPFFPTYLQGIGDSINLRHSTESTVAACAFAAACAVFLWGGGLACAGCVIASATCGWGLGEAFEPEAPPES